MIALRLQAMVATIEYRYFLFFSMTAGSRRVYAAPLRGRRGQCGPPPPGAMPKEIDYERFGPMGAAEQEAPV